MNLSCQFLMTILQPRSPQTNYSPALLERHPPLARLGGPGSDLTSGLAVGAEHLLLRIQAVHEAKGKLRPGVREVRPQHV